MPFTDSVRSRQVPDTPFTSACPPSLPSVPTSRATRVTSSAKDESWSTIVFTVVPIRRNSPFTGWPSIVRAILRSRSPSATASSTLATSVVGRTRSSINAFSDSTLDSQPPPAEPSDARWSMRPSRPITRRMRDISFSMRPFIVTSSLYAAPISPSRPRRRRERRFEKSPSRAATSASRISSSTAGSTPEPFAAEGCPVAVRPAPFALDCFALLLGALAVWVAANVPPGTSRSLEVRGPVQTRGFRRCK